MSLAAIDVFAIVLATVVSMIVGTIWYTAFARSWQRAARTEDHGTAARTGNIALAALSEFVMAAVFALLLAHFPTVSLPDAVLSALALWLGFVATTVAVSQRFLGFGWDLTAIEAGHWLVVLLGQGLVFGSL
ncbi:DUF1761 domain-containing protein [Jiella sonneratiae]|uniref:DUF1761 domain-containing protein n=1 Tax=Jiella sonneratiae TaxID=2816856 RepID=A0ABS3J0Z2_9HYPH|nr:DUF1761 domain-containing protein [Jiella sonneratiae]MBO0903324.1 DUF1761 domain-containing protein [Jiella sonneratiae]